MRTRQTKTLQKLNRLARYGAVGVVAAAIHYGALRGLSLILAEWLANPIAFLAASIAGYLGHALLTFREETGGQRFARRWLLLQYAVNLSVCGVLPLLLSGVLPQTAHDLVLVFTPTVLNALIWSRAAQFTARRRRQTLESPLWHADDLGLAAGVDAAILELARSGHVDGASLLVDGPTARSAAMAWRALDRPRSLCLHLCLTEGPDQSSGPDLPASFGQLLLASLLPQQQRRIRPQLEHCIRRQVTRYRDLTGETRIRLDGHQHIHLVPVVLSTVLNLADELQIDWIRTTAEPLPTHLPWRDWSTAVRSGGLLKWIVLQVLSALALPKLLAHGIGTNTAFAGVLFTGRMAGLPLIRSLEALETTHRRRGLGPALLLAHPAAEESADGLKKDGFALSSVFFASPWRQEEWKALRAHARHG